MRNLSDLIKAYSFISVTGNKDREISALVFDSRKIVTGCCFFAIHGTRSDGHQFIETAIADGASAIVCTRLPQALNPQITYLLADDSEKAMGYMASAFYHFPSQKLNLVGVTGTNGKTTTATLLFRLVKQLGYKAGLLSTVCNYIDNEYIASTHTTPDAVEINRLIHQMAEKGCEWCFMEVSSHAIVQNRIAGLHFKTAIFTNITQDHLDYHKTFDEYIRAKKQFFDQLPTDATALYNADDRHGKVMVQNTTASVKNFGLKTIADYKCRIIESHFDGMLLELDQTETWVRLTGEFNAYNLCGIYATALLSGFGKEEVLTVLSSLTAVDGRFQTYKSESGKTAIVDYAHTPDAVENVLKTIKQILPKGNQVITVIGAGGDRDKTKRPLMAAIASKMSQKVILTSDNPRSEDPEEILNDMMNGIDSTLKKNVLRITDRREAIRTGLMLANSGDVVLIAGKGHETYQEIKGVKYHFDDREIVKEIFNTLN